jgi:hypothetical protein
MDLQTYLIEAYNFVHASFATVNSQVALLLVALIAAIIMKSWKQLWAMAFVALVLDILVMVFMPLIGRGQFHLPDFLALRTLVGLVELYVGLVVVIAIFFLLKTLFMKTAKAA